jgi:hypothetical protein
LWIEVPVAPCELVLVVLYGCITNTWFEMSDGTTTVSQSQSLSTAGQHHLQEHEHWFLLSADPISRAQVIMAGAFKRLHAVNCISISRLGRVKDVRSDN